MSRLGRLPRSPPRPTADHEGRLTASTPRLDELLTARRGWRQPHWTQVVYPLYVTALFGGVYVLPYAQWLRQPELALPVELRVHLLRQLPALLIIGTCAVGVATARWMRWTGPARLLPADVEWLLDAPVDRTGLLRHLLRRALLVSAAAGFALGLLLATVLQLVLTRELTARLLVAPVTGAATALLLAASSAAVQPCAHRARWASAASGTSWAIGLLAVGRLVLASSLAGGGSDAISGWWLVAGGPWTWPAAALVWSCHSGTGGLPDDAAATALVSLLLAATLVCAQAIRTVGLAPRHRLLVAANTAVQASSAVLTLDTRQAVVAVQSTLVSPRGTHWPYPERRWLVPVWRTALVWSHRPGRFFGALLAAGAAGWLIAGQVAAPDLGTRLAATSTAAVALYVAAVQASEPVRVEADDPRRSDALPWTFSGWLARLSVVATSTVLSGVGAGAVLAGAVNAESGDPGRRAGLLLLVPTAVAIAVASACRGRLPPELLVGVVTPMGGTGPVQAALWLLREPAAMLAVATPVVVWIADDPAPASTPVAYVAGLAPDTMLLALIGAAVAATWWARARAAALRRG